MEILEKGPSEGSRAFIILTNSMPKALGCSSLFSPMNKTALAEMIHEKIGGTKVQSEEIVQSIFDAIVSTLKKGDDVSIAGFGIFSSVKKAARMARNPKTGEMVQVAAKNSPKFKAGKALKDAVK